MPISRDLSRRIKKLGFMPLAGFKAQVCAQPVCMQKIWRSALLLQQQSRRCHKIYGNPRQRHANLSRDGWGGRILTGAQAAPYIPIHRDGRASVFGGEGRSFRRECGNGKNRMAKGYDIRFRTRIGDFGWNRGSSALSETDHRRAFRQRLNDPSKRDDGD